ncbi:ABC transporter permease [Paraflavitalea pollutisoli]|uniref:ABC transporter permease n=1 Tax=Paraflavitalea pollutisoli TaxID=3034143 RepID=UPI0023EE0465|nr:ABC transporter permease [Paraflavitalea sp. H1-2-19X]
MFKNYLKTAWRNLWKNKAYSAINIIGLSIGMAACIVIMLFVLYEKGFDGRHTKNIYRLDEVQKFPGMVAPQQVALSMFPMGPTLQAEFPQVKQFTRINSYNKPPITYGDKKVSLTNLFWADSTFLDIFNFRLLEGDRLQVLQQPNSVVLTQSAADKIFGRENPVGKTITINGSDTMTFKVTGILENIPGNSHLQFEGLLSFNTRPTARMMENWGGNWVNTYLELAPGTDIAALEKAFPAYLKRHMTEERSTFYELFLQPLAAVHAGSSHITHDYNNYGKFDGSYTNLFSIIALIVLVIACINFMNLSTARSAGRAREVGVRKSVGAHRFQLGIQFIGESVLLCILALMIALGLVQLTLPWVSQLSQRDLNMIVFINGPLLLTALAGSLLVGILAGLYPAVYLSSFQAVKVLKGTITAGNRKSLFRNVLVVGQFSSAIFLIIATLFAVRQLNFMQHKDPGFNKEQVLTIPLTFATQQRYEAVKSELLNNTLITGVSASTQRLGNNLHQTGVNYYPGDKPMRSLTTSQVVVDPDYLSVYKIPLLAGRNFSKDYATDNAKAYIVNETMAKELLKETPQAPYASLIGKRFGFGGMDSAGTIVGVSRDFNFNSLHHKIETLTILDQKDWGYSEISVRVNGAKAKEAVAFIQGVWQKVNPGEELEFTFLDDHFKELYHADAQVSQTVGVLAGLAIVISCLGLFGLASYAAERRIKEIGIRKVLGASIQSIVRLMSKDFLRLVLIANLIAWPLAWLAMYKWLEDFAYRIPISIWVFLAAGVAALLIALCTVAFQALRASIANPVKSLRSE